ncbi:phosphate/phosphite/phosphonate ABC transporter substrate-binding protein [Vibrio mexicanus]|uniref:phosphate/phosphite/phosphonate ABC transporter substrate-binding protein n=1 Tax=Vibrio mexicanus TaxID=1004326 RepID=UPI00063CD7E9|nr:phosphate/phosphite/phosphonate ABC transporter substrate-binding protein [Vibrio mexicanus]
MRTLFVALLLLTSTAVHSERFTFAIVPQQSASRLAELWTPIMDHLSEKTGHEFVFVTAVDIPTFEQRLKNGEYDFSYMNPYHFTVFNQSPGYQAIAKAKDKQIKGIIVARKDSNIQSLGQLNGSQLAFPSPAAFAATILTQAELNGRNVEFTPKYVSSHDSVYLSVARGLFPAGGGVMRTFRSLDEEVRSQLTPIWTTNGYTPHAIAAHPDLAPKVVQEIQQLLVNLHESPMGLNQLERLKIKGFVSATNNDWDDVRALNIQTLEP